MCLSLDHLNFSKILYNLGYIQGAWFAIMLVEKESYKFFNHVAPPCTALNTKQKVNISKVFLESLPNVDATL